MKLLSTTTAFTLSTLTNAWQNEQGNWGECGRLPNFNALLQESNYNVAYELDEKFMQHVAKVSPANCQADIDKDQGKYDKYIAKKDKKNKEKDAAKAKRKAEAAAKKKQKMKDREEKLKAKEEAKSNGEDIPKDEKNEKSKKSEEEKREIRLKKKQERDAAKAHDWYSKAAAQGCPDSKHMLGWCYAEGDGAQQSDVMAMYWWRGAASKGVVDSMTCLGYSFKTGCYGVLPDPRKAHMWFERAAKSSTTGKLFLGCCYELGVGAAKDSYKAQKLLIEAAGDKEGWSRRAGKLMSRINEGQQIDWPESIFSSDEESDDE